MKTKILTLGLLFFVAGLTRSFALEHAQKDGLFSMDVPQGWQWIEYPQEIIVTYPDGKTMAMDIQMAPGRELSQAQIKQAIKDGDDKMIREGVLAHNGTLIDNKEMAIDGVYATRLDFKTSPPDPVLVTYVSLFNKGHAITITYGNSDEKMYAVMDDALSTLKLR